MRPLVVTISARTKRRAEVAITVIKKAVIEPSSPRGRALWVTRRVTVYFPSVRAGHFTGVNVSGTTGKNAADQAIAEIRRISTDWPSDDGETQD